MADAQQIRREVRSYILEQFLPGEPPESLSDDTKLVGEGILSSIDVIKLITFLEDHFRITLASHEVILGPMSTVDSITAMVAAKLG